jgi:hypothetical protein
MRGAWTFAAGWLVACGGEAEDDTATARVVDLNGRWDATWVVASVEGGCGIAVGDVSQAVLTVDHDPATDDATITGFDQDSSATGEGRVTQGDAGATLAYTSTAADAAGRTERDGGWVVSASGNAMSGEEAWTWTATDGSGGACAGTSGVTLDRQL